MVLAAVDLVSAILYCVVGQDDDTRFSVAVRNRPLRLRFADVARIALNVEENAKIREAAGSACRVQANHHNMLGVGRFNRILKTGSVGRDAIPSGLSAMAWLKAASQEEGLPFPSITVTSQPSFAAASFMKTPYSCDVSMFSSPER